MIPKIDLPIYEIKLPFTKKVVKYRPFVVKEEKLLLIAAQGKDTKESTKTILQVVNNCVLEIEGGKTKVEDLPAFEIDYLFLNMRAKSIGSIIKQELVCNNLIDGGTKCGMVLDVPIDVAEVTFTAEPSFKSVKLDNNLQISLKYPKFRIYDMEKEGIEYDILIDCVDYLFNDKEVYNIKDEPREKMIELFENLTKETFLKLQEYYDSLPYMYIEKDIKCTKCGFIHKMRLEDPLDFF